MDSLPNCVCWTSFLQCYPISSTLYMCMSLLFFNTIIPNEDDPFLVFFLFISTFSIFHVRISCYPYIVIYNIPRSATSKFIMHGVLGRLPHHIPYKFAKGCKSGIPHILA